MDRGKVLWEEDLEELDGKWARYADVDGDSIPYRTLPGNRHPAASYFARGTGHTPDAQYSEDADVWRENLERLKRKFEVAKQYVPKPILSTMPDADFGIIAYGSTEPAIEEARVKLRAAGTATDFLRGRSLPFTAEIDKFIEDHERIFVVEMNRDGQLYQLLTIEYPGMTDRLVSIAYTDGLPLTARRVREMILAKME
jgi:2-oxoglutarate ferredoxin oxidoreductase subunit alpha